MATGVQSLSSVWLTVYPGEIAFCDTLRDLVTLLQFKKCEKSYREVLLLVLLLHGVFHVFLIAQMVPNGCKVSHKFKLKCLWHHREK